MMFEINTYEEFCDYIGRAGLLAFTPNTAGLPSLEGLSPPKLLHTGLDSDPWVWKDRIAAEGIAAYAKLFNKRPGFVSREFYPLFLAARRGRLSFDALYADGVVSRYAYQIYHLFDSRPVLSTHEIKVFAGFKGEDKGKYETAMTALQSQMYITVCGTSRKLSRTGEPYNWPSTAYTTVDKWAGEALLQESFRIPKSEAVALILERAHVLAPHMDAAIRKFLLD